MQGPWTGTHAGVYFQRLRSNTTILLEFQRLDFHISFEVSATLIQTTPGSDESDNARMCRRLSNTKPKFYEPLSLFRLLSSLRFVANFI